ncbi:hypothetical protein LTS10_007794 [Elasticomyces elasticus]|nr:hypothetical protein LTS10_007794 [Elasticomyces elasticus]
MAPSKPQVKPQEFRLIPQGKGGTFIIDPTSRSIERIDLFGTWECNTCVGVSWPINDKRCFLAHINCIFADTTERKRCVVHDDAEGEEVKRMVKRELTAESNRAKWGPVTEVMKAGVVMVCPKQTEEVFDATTRQTITRMLTGHYVAEAIKEWLGAPDLKADTMHGGFIVRHPGSLPELLSQENVDDIKRKFPPPMWKQREESGSNVKSWIIMIPRAKQA